MRSHTKAAMADMLSIVSCVLYRPRTLRHATVSDVWFDNLNGVVLEIVIKLHVTHSVMFNL